MKAVTIREAKAHLNELIQAATRGEQVVLMRGSKHVAALVPLSAEELELAPRLSDPAGRAALAPARGGAPCRVEPGLREPGGDRRLSVGTAGTPVHEGRLPERRDEAAPPLLMRIALGRRFQRDVAALSKERRVALFEAIRALPGAIGDPHRHGGLGIRKLHSSGIWEARVGLGLRLVFAVEPGLLTLVRVGTHDEIRGFLREL